MENAASEQAQTGLTSGVTRETLPNGLTVLIKENHAAPVAAVLVSVKAGYFQEPDRINGIAHVLEHMLFKGTPRRPEDEQIAREVRELGGYINAGTYYEETTYYLTVPSQHVSAAMDILADACQNSLLDGDELAKEIEVIVQESEQKRDNPNAILLESLYALAFDAHRIRRWRIGHPETLRAFRSEDLKQFVADNYRPDNMVLTVVGDVNAAQVMATARSLWGDLQGSDKPRELSPTEPAHGGFRYQRLNGQTKQRLLLFAMPVPDTLHPDAAPLMVLSSLLSDGRSARLYRQLKEELNLVNSAWASYESFEQMGIFTLGAEVVADDPLPAERALWAEVRRVQHETVEGADLERIKTRIRTRRLFAQEEVMGMARNLSHYEQLGDYHLADVLVERLRAVTPEDVQRVARTYVQVAHSALLEYLPADSQAPAPLAPAELAAVLEEQNVSAEMDTADAPQTPADLTVFVRSHTADTQEIDLPHGGKLLYKERRDLPIIAFNALFRGGKKRENRNIAGLTNLMLKTSLKGANGTNVLPPLSAEEIANRVESLGTGIGLSVGMEYFGWGLKSSRDVFREAFDLFAAVASAPAFPPAELDKEKQSIYAEIRRQQDNNYSLANDLFAAARFGDEHPYGLPASGITEAVQSRYSTDLRDWYYAQVQPNNLIVSCVGALTAQEAVDLFGRLIEERWKGGEIREGQDSPSTTNHQPPATRILHRQKQQTAAMMGFDGANMFSPDRFALDVLNEITSGMGGRLFRAVRGENSLAYQVTSAHRSRVDVGSFITYTSTAPENEERARDLILNALRELQREHVTGEELRMAKASLVGEHVINMQTFASQAGELAVIGVYGLPLDESERYLKEIQNVTAEQVKDVAIRYLNTEKYWLGVVRGGTAEGAMNPVL